MIIDSYRFAAAWVDATWHTTNKGPGIALSNGNQTASVIDSIDYWDSKYGAFVDALFPDAQEVKWYTELEIVLSGGGTAWPRLERATADLTTEEQIGIGFALAGSYTDVTVTYGIAIRVSDTGGGSWMIEGWVRDNSESWTGGDPSEPSGSGSGEISDSAVEVYLGVDLRAPEGGVATCTIKQADAYSWPIPTGYVPISN